MGQKNKIAKGRLDKYYHLAKEQGYRSRAAFKLIQLNQKFNFLGGTRCLIDLCAAPGGWTQVAAKYMPMDSTKIAIDLYPIRRIKGSENVHTLVQDITTKKCRDCIRKIIGKDRKAGVILHDGSPNVGGAWVKDAYGQCELALLSLKLATGFLRPGGLFITKVFRSADYNSLLWVCQQLFKSVSAFKPPASRAASAETYLVCKGFLAPKKIDSRLLDPRHAFKHIPKEKKKINVLTDKKHGRKTKPNRDGYDTTSLLISKVPVLNFIQSAKACEMLGDHNLMFFDEQSKLFENHEKTTQEIKYLLQDLKVLGKKDFRRLLKWRQVMKKYYQDLQAEAADAAGDADDEGEASEEEEELDPEAKMDAEMLQLREKYKRNKRRARKKERAKLIKLTRRMKMGNLDGQTFIDDSQHIGMFQVKKLKSEKELDMVAEGAGEDIDPATLSSDGDYHGSDSEGEMKLEDTLASMYNEYKVRRNIRDKRQRLKVGLEDSDDEGEQEEAAAVVKETVQLSDEEGPGALVVAAPKRQVERSERASRFFSDPIFDGIEDEYDGSDEGQAEDGGDEVPDADSNDEGQDGSDDAEGDASSEKEGASNASADTGAKPSKGDAQDFCSSGSDSSDDEEAGTEVKEATVEVVPPEETSSSTSSPAKVGSGSPAKVGSGGATTLKPRTPVKKRTRDDVAKEEAEEPSWLKGTPVEFGEKQTGEARRKRARRRREEFEQQKQEDKLTLTVLGKESFMFEEVPLSDAEKSSDWSSSDSDAVAEVLALGHKMLRKKNRQKIINDSYSRYAFDDRGLELPLWFTNEEALHNKRKMPITKAEVNEFKAKLRAINARPIKKLAEAKARKKWRALKAWNKLKQQATAITANKTMSEGQKLKTIERLYKKDKGRKKGPLKVVVSTKSGGKEVKGNNSEKGKKGRTKLVDRRMKTDLSGRGNRMKFGIGNRKRNRGIKLGKRGNKGKGDKRKGKNTSRAKQKKRKR